VPTERLSTKTERKRMLAKVGHRKVVRILRGALPANDVGILICRGCDEDGRSRRTRARAAITAIS
jgi:hypothetical protein